MAGGKSVRMEKDKGFVLFRGKAMAQHGLDLLQNHFQKCYISTNNNAYDVFGLPLISDIHPGIGPMGGIHAALNTINGDSIFLLGCDIPNVNGDLIKILIENFNDEEIVLPIHGSNQLEPLCGIYSKKCLKRIKDMIADKNFKLHDLITSSKTKYVNVDVLIKKTPQLFENINTPAQLE